MQYCGKRTPHGSVGSIRKNISALFRNVVEIMALSTCWPVHHWLFLHLLISNRLLNFYCSVNRSCRKGFRPCYNQRCVANSRFCDGIDDCGDNSDEAFCSSESQPFDLLFKLSCLWGQDPATLMLILIRHTRPQAALSLRRLMSPKIITSAQIQRGSQPPPLKAAFGSPNNTLCPVNTARLTLFWPWRGNNPVKSTAVFIFLL